mgnify:CR=1 FL=1
MGLNRHYKPIFRDPLMSDQNEQIHRLLWSYDNNAGRNPETPFNIFALPLARTVGDFIEHVYSHPVLR